MTRWLILAALAVAFVAARAQAAGLSGSYLEARTTDVYTGPCFANADMNLTGKDAVLAWKVDRGSFDNVALDGLSVVAVVTASDTLGTEQTGAAKSVLIVDKRATEAQKAALVRLAKKQAGDLLRNVVAVERTDIELKVNCCKERGCASLKAGDACVTTRCLDHQHDKVCGNETAFYPPLTAGVTAQPAVAVENEYRGKNLRETWRDDDRHGAYVGTFELR